jgi:hypothetical protein
MCKCYQPKAQRQPFKTMQHVKLSPLNWNQQWQHQPMCKCYQPKAQRRPVGVNIE